MSKVVSCNLKNKAIEDERKFDCEILMSTYNGEKYIDCQIESILSQKDVNVKLLIRDDGSKDNTVEIIKKYQEKYLDKIELIEGENVGIHRSFASLIDQAKGLEYIAFADQDDRWDRDKLITGILALKQNKASFYSSAARLVDQELNELGTTTSAASKYKYYMCTNSKVLTPGAQGCTIILDNKLFDLIRKKGYPNDYGHDTWITIVAYLMSNCLYDDQAHMDYRQHNESWTGNRSKKIKQFFVKVGFFFKGLERYEKLSKDVLQRYRDILDSNSIEVLTCIAEKDKSLLKRASNLYHYKYGKYGKIEDVVYKIYYIFS